MIYYTIKGAKTNVRQWVFPGGEVGIDINIGSERVDYNTKDIRVTSHIKGSDDILALCLTTDAIKRQFPKASLSLHMPYIPYARQDRVCNTGESLSIKVLSAIINSLGYTSVIVEDPHSPVSEACINGIQVVDQYDLFGYVRSFSDYFIVAPDAGATKKCDYFAKRVGARGVITCHKTRELSSGKIVGLELNSKENLKGTNLFVLDDLCDGGRTFIELHKLLSLHNPNKIELAVTHGIFSKGVDIITDLYDHVFTTNSFHHDLAWSGKLTVIKI